MHPGAVLVTFLAPRQDEALTRRAFWNVHTPGCRDHYLVHCLRQHADFIPELDFVLELDGQLIGSILFSRSQMVDARLRAAGMDWYEVSNWAKPGGECQHNRIYWVDGNWWGAGPGAHSHVSGVRWWNVKHPRSYSEALRQGVSPAAAREVLAPDDRRIERVLLESRLSSGLPLSVLTPSEQARVRDLVARGWVALNEDALTLTLQGRLLADAVVRDLLD